MNILRALLLLVVSGFLAACASPPSPPPSAGDCTTIRLWSNGWHVNLAFEAGLLAEEHPVRALFPEADYFLVGWGDRDFYMAENAGFWLGLKAAVAPTRSVMQVIAAQGAPVEESVWPPSDLVEIAISQAGATRLADEIANALVLDGEGRPIGLMDGRVEGASLFLAARGRFHLFNMCNHWTARRLREAGVPVRAGVSFTAPGLLDAARRKTQPACRDVAS